MNFGGYSHLRHKWANLRCLYPTQGLVFFVYQAPAAAFSSFVSLHHVLQRSVNSLHLVAGLLTPVPIAIREYDAKLLLAYWLERAPPVAPNAQVKTNFQYPSVKVAQISWDPSTNAITPDIHVPNWVHNTKLVAKPDQLIKRRGKAGLLSLNKTWEESRQWIAERAGKPQKVCVTLRLYRSRRLLVASRALLSCSYLSIDS